MTTSLRTVQRIAAALAATAVAAVGVGPGAHADQPSREVVPVETDGVFTGWCPFPVRLQESGTVVVTTFLGDKEGITKESDVASNYRGTLTNQDNGIHIALTYPGGLHITYYADGSHTTRGTGPSLIAPPVPSPATGVLGLWLVRGQFRYEVDASGRITTSNLTGTQADLCAQLSH